MPRSALSLPYERASEQMELTLSDGKEAGQQVMTGRCLRHARLFRHTADSGSGRTHLHRRRRPDAQRVAIVNRTFARKFFHGANPVGRYVDKNTVIVGVVADVPIAPG